MDKGKLSLYKGKCYYVASASTGFVGLYDGGTEDVVTLKDAVICQRMRVQSQPGQVVVFNSFEPINVMEKREEVVHIKFDYWFEIENDSELYDVYKKIIEGWRIERSGLVSPTSEQTQNIIDIHEKK